MDLENHDMKKLTMVDFIIYIHESVNFQEIKLTSRQPYCNALLLEYLQTNICQNRIDVSTYILDNCRKCSNWLII